MNGLPRPTPGQPGQAPPKEALEGQLNSMRLRLSIVEERLKCLTALADTLSGESGDNAANVLGQSVVESIAALLGSFVMEAQIEQQILSQSVAQLEAVIRQMSSGIVVPQFGVPRQ